MALILPHTHTLKICRKTAAIYINVISCFHVSRCLREAASCCYLIIIKNVADADCG